MIPISGFQKRDDTGQDVQHQKHCDFHSSVLLRLTEEHWRDLAAIENHPEKTVPYAITQDLKSIGYCEYITIASGYEEVKITDKGRQALKVHQGGATSL